MPALIGPTGALKAALRPRPFGPPFQQILDPPLFEYTGNKAYGSHHSHEQLCLISNRRAKLLNTKYCLNALIAWFYIYLIN